MERFGHRVRVRPGPMAAFFLITCLRATMTVEDLVSSTGGNESSTRALLRRGYDAAISSDGPCDSAARYRQAYVNRE